MITRLLEAAVWWALLVGLWLLTVAPVTAPDEVAAVIGALPCAVAAGAARRAVGSSWRLRAGWLRWLPALPVAVLADTARVLAASLRPRAAEAAARTEPVPLPPPGPADPAEAATRRAVVTLLLSLTPGSFVYDVTEAAEPHGAGDRGDRGDVVHTHVLVDGPPRMSEVVRR